ncbi:MAG TPA: ParB/RepB/Spo0J family partition protein [Deltaproteobacteria bacterium]|nr:ParB/RepB/Spo0J family partition protein [Deltaproteobacteria bacterium]
MEGRKRRVLGRGLGALIGEKAASGRREKFVYCAPSEIRTNRFQPRRIFDEAALSELVDSIREKGVIEPLVARRGADGIELIAGERRLRAATLAGLKEVPVVMVEATDRESLELAVIENIQREDLNPIEEAEAYSRLMDFGLSQEEVAAKVGKERATVANYLRLLKLPPEVKDELGRGTISMGHARAIVSLPTAAAQRELCRRVISRGLSVRETERLAKAALGGGRKKAAGAGPQETDRQLRFVEDELRALFGTKVSIRENNGKGRVEFAFYSAQERERLLELLRSAAGR